MISAPRLRTARASLVLPLLANAFHFGRRALERGEILLPTAYCQFADDQGEVVLGVRGVPEAALQMLYAQIRQRLMVCTTPQPAIVVLTDVDLPASLGRPEPEAIRAFVEAPGYSRYFYLPYVRSKAKDIEGRAIDPSVRFGLQISVEARPIFFEHQETCSQPNG